MEGHCTASALGKKTIADIGKKLNFEIVCYWYEVSIIFNLTNQGASSYSNSRSMDTVSILLVDEIGSSNRNGFLKLLTKCTNRQIV